MAHWMKCENRWDIAQGSTQNSVDMHHKCYVCSFTPYSIRSFVKWISVKQGMFVLNLQLLLLSGARSYSQDCNLQWFRTSRGRWWRGFFWRSWGETSFCNKETAMIKPKPLPSPFRGDQSHMREGTALWPSQSLKAGASERWPQNKIIACRHSFWSRSHTDLQLCFLVIPKKGLIMERIPKIRILAV